MTADIEEQNLIEFNQYAFGTEDIEYICIPFWLIEEIFFKDMDTYLYLSKYYDIYNRSIFESEWTESDIKLQEFIDSEKAIMFVREDGTIFDVNDPFCDMFEVDEHKM